MNSISFQNQEFETRYLDLVDFGTVLIATTELSNKLLTKDYDYVSDEARHVDELILFFIEKTDMRLSDKKLGLKISKDIG